MTPGACELAVRCACRADQAVHRRGSVGAQTFTPPAEPTLVSPVPIRFLPPVALLLA
jgi:hypothetical protein